MADLVLHPQTADQVSKLIERPIHAIMLTGPTGSGKSAVATHIAESLLGLPRSGFSAYGYGMTIGPSDKGSIGIEAVRELEHFLSLKVPGKAAIHRVIIIESVHTMTGEAQNALLKTLEEPPAGTVLILTATREHDVLPTVRSRTQSIAIQKPLKDDTTRYFEQLGHDPALVQQSYVLSGGLPGLLSCLVSQEDHPLRLATQKARQLLGQKTYERLLLVDELAKQKQLAQDTLFILQQMAHISLQSAANSAATRWQRVLTASYQASEQLAGSAQPKLVLTNLCLNL